MLIAQISDLHVGPPGGEMDRRFDTAAHAERAAAHVNRLDPAPDVVLVTGDLVEDGTAEEYRRLRGFLDRLSAPYFLIPGNHDDRDNLRRAFADHGYLQGDGAFLHYVIEDYPLRLIGLDTLLPGKARGELCPARLAWLEARLGEAPGRPTLVFMHHPPFRTGLAHMDRSRLADAERLGEIVARHAACIEGIVCGHVHRPIQRRWHGTVVSTAPSTAHQIALDLRDGEPLSVVMEPPACHLHVWFPDDGLVSHLSYIDPGAKPEPRYGD